MQKSLHAILLLFVASSGLLISASCSTSAPKTTSRASPDESLTTDEYLKLGIAAPDRIWSAHDLTQAVQVLEKLSQQGSRSLPRYKSERSGQIFARMTAAENLALLKSPDTPIAVRLPMAAEIQQQQVNLLKIYLNAFLKRQVRGAELLELQVSNLRVSQSMTDLAREFLPTLDPNDPTYEVRMKGVEQMKHGMSEQVAGSLQTMEERENYAAEDLQRYIESLQEILPTIISYLSPAAQTETMATLDRLCNDSTHSDLHRQLKRLREKARAALK